MKKYAVFFCFLVLIRFIDGCILTPTGGKVTVPAFSPEPGRYPSPFNVSIVCSTPGVIIYYTTDGSEPLVLSTKYEGAVSVSENTTVRAFATKEDMDPSEVITGWFTISPKVAALTFTPKPKTHYESIYVTIACATPDALIYYTTDGSIPTTSSTLYAAPFLLGDTTTIKSLAVKDGKSDSEVVTAPYILKRQVPEPTFSPSPGTYASSVKVKIHCEYLDVGIFYRTDGSTPTKSISDAYIQGQEITLTQATTTIKAFAADAEERMRDSEIAAAIYTVIPGN